MSDGSIGEYEIPDEWYKKFLGGRGLGARILLEELDKEVDALGSENILVFGTGPLQGTGIPGASRNLVMSKSPRTGTISGSYVGGFFPHELGKSGYDGIIIRGSSDSPKYLTIIDAEAELHDATDLWGKGTAEVEEMLQERHSGGKVSSIGVAGENLVKYACIINDRNRAAGRPGYGAVMGSKNLKSILIKGETEKPIKNKEKLEEAIKKFTGLLTSSSTMDWGKYGTTGALLGLNEEGALPTKNFQKGSYEEAEDISGERMYDTITTSRDNCTGCPVRCKRVVKTEYKGEEVPEKYGGPEYETLAIFGSLTMNNNLKSIALANKKCNEYGLDTISTGNVIAFLMEASEKGLVDEEISWGDSKKMVDMIDKIAHREGNGDLLSKGVNEMAEELNVDFDMQVKGQEIPMHEPRGKKALGLSYATSPRGANHMEVFHDDGLTDHPEEVELSGEIDRLDLESKPKFCKVYEDIVSFSNSLVMCAFTSWTTYLRGGENRVYPYPKMRERVKHLTGIDLNKEQTMEIGERNYNLLKLLSSREGITKEDDGLPKRFAEEFSEGGTARSSIPEEDLDQKIDEYYELRGWDERGPTESKLKELNIENLT